MMIKRKPVPISAPALYTSASLCRQPPHLTRLQECTLMSQREAACVGDIEHLLASVYSWHKSGLYLLSARSMPNPSTDVISKAYSSETQTAAVLLLELTDVQSFF